MPIFANPVCVSACQRSVALGVSIAAMTVMVARHCDAADFSASTPIVAKLSSPTTAIVDGRAFRVGLESLAQSAGVNVWIDRHVDPTAPIAAGQLGPTIYDAITRVAAGNQCEVLVTETVVVIGRRDWLDQVAEAVASKRPRRKKQPPIGVRWEALTTPSEALASVTSKTGETLPHDLWPAVDWQDTNARVAEALIRAQFELDDAVESGDAGKTIRPTHRYRDVSLETIESAIVKLDGDANVRKRSRYVEVQTHVAGHRAIMNALVQAAAGKKGAKTGTGTFTLTTRARAVDILKKLAGVGGLTCVIEPAATQACDAQVTLEAKDATVEELVKMVAEQVGCEVEFKVGGFVVRR